MERMSKNKLSRKFFEGRISGLGFALFRLSECSDVGLREHLEGLIGEEIRRSNRLVSLCLDESITESKDLEEE